MKLPQIVYMADVSAAMNTAIPGAQPAPLGRGEKAANTRARNAKRAAKKAAAPKKRKAKKAKAPKVAKVKQTRRGRNAISLDLQAATSLLGSMHRTDLPVFEALSGALSAQGVPSRKRLLAALNQVFGG